MKRPRHNDRWYVRYQWREQSVITKGVVPLLFNSEEAAWEYLNSFKIPFLNLRGKRKLSASVGKTILKP